MALKSRLSFGMPRGGINGRRRRRRIRQDLVEAGPFRNPILVYRGGSTGDSRDAIRQLVSARFSEHAPAAVNTFTSSEGQEPEPTATTLACTLCRLAGPVPIPTGHVLDGVGGLCMYSNITRT
ncbi:hypothetical protein J3F83DRAFT_454443 [Trichoderma novae-zelandiae]